MGIGASQTALPAPSPSGARTIAELKENDLNGIYFFKYLTQILNNEELDIGSISEWLSSPEQFMGLEILKNEMDDPERLEACCKKAISFINISLKYMSDFTEITSLLAQKLNLSVKPSRYGGQQVSSGCKDPLQFFIKTLDRVILSLEETDSRDQDNIELFTQKFIECAHDIKDPVRARVLVDSYAPFNAIGTFTDKISSNERSYTVTLKSGKVYELRGRFEKTQLGDPKFFGMVSLKGSAQPASMCEIQFTTEYKSEKIH